MTYQWHCLCLNLTHQIVKPKGVIIMGLGLCTTNAKKGGDLIKILELIGGVLLGIIFMFILWAAMWVGCALDDVCYHRNTTTTYIEGKWNG